MHTVNLITRLVEHNQVLVYAIIFLGIIFEGEFVIIFAGVLAHLGALNIFLALVFILMGGIAKTFFGYKLGQFLFRKFNHHKFFSYIQKRVYGLLPKFKAKPFWSIFISKFIIGANNVVIIFCGYEKVNYKKYFKAEALATLIWAPFLLSLGYVFSYTALRVSKEIWRFSMVVMVLVLIFILFDKLVSWIYELFEEYYNDRN
ncbi:VTT domain-containing protein [Candidatus Nomurabacteria bacterium]|nr:VTT domain-containing protein [Candidatus Nomurabacteria bacterium]